MPEPTTVGEACQKFLADAKTRELREPTLYKYRLLFRRLQAFAQENGLRFIKDFGVDALRQFRASWPHRGTSANKRLEELRAFFRFCWESGWIPENWAGKLKPQKAEDPPREPFSEEEVEGIRAACDRYARSGKVDAHRLRALIDLLLETGLRIGDAVTLRRDSIFGDKLRLRTAKTGTVVYCPLPPWLVEELRMVRGTSNEYFFWSGQGKPRSCVGNWQRSLKRLFRLAGIPGCAHRFRHTTAKRLLMAGVLPERVAVLLGHRNAGITLKYYAQWVRERQEQLEAEVRRVQQMYARYPLYGGSGVRQVQ